MAHYESLGREKPSALLEEICACAKRWLSTRQASGEMQKLHPALRELSERELSLARLMAGRRTNREIAEALYLSRGPSSSTSTASIPNYSLAALRRKSAARSSPF